MPSYADMMKTGVVQKVDFIITSPKQSKHGIGERKMTEDTISRQAAIDAVYKCTNYFIGNLPTMITKDDAYKVLHEVPSAERNPDRKVGKWVEEDDDIIHGHCSSCGWVSVWQETDVFGMNYCPNCGADMRGDNDG